jgi:hypothetical protein
MQIKQDKRKQLNLSLPESQIRWLKEKQEWKISVSEYVANLIQYDKETHWYERVILNGAALDGIVKAIQRLESLVDHYGQQQEQLEKRLDGLTTLLQQFELKQPKDVKPEEQTDRQWATKKGTNGTVIIRRKEN